MTNEEMFQNIESFTVGLDDTFSFHCTQCGKCCIHRTDIILSPRDIFKMAKELKLSNADFLRKYCSMHIGPTSRIPVITLRPVGKDDRCPLLRNNKCSVHRVKPSVCGMFPLGRYIAFGKDDFGKKELNCGEVKYLLQPIECGDKSETHTVREWFGDFDVSLEDTAFVHWNQAMSVISMKLKELEMQLDMMVMMSLWLTVRIALYENYTSTEEFLPQFDANVEDVIKLLDDIPKLKEMVNNGRKP